MVRTPCPSDSQGEGECHRPKRDQMLGPSDLMAGFVLGCLLHMPGVVFHGPRSPFALSVQIGVAVRRPGPRLPEGPHPTQAT